MSSISFMFYLPDDPIPKFGKIWLNYWSDDHDGFDYEVRPYVERAMARILKKEFSGLRLAILGMADEFCSKEEKRCLDLFITDTLECYWLGKEVPDAF